MPKQPKHNTKFKTSHKLHVLKYRKKTINNIIQLLDDTDVRKQIKIIHKDVSSLINFYDMLLNEHIQLQNTVSQLRKELNEFFAHNKYVKK